MNKVLLLLLLFLYFSAVNSEIYKTIDEDGNVIFTDKKPSIESEEIEVNEVQKIKASKSSSLSEIENTNVEKEKDNTNTKIAISLLDHYKKMKPSLDKSDWHIHDPSRVINANSSQIISVTGKAQEDGYKCGLETWRRTDPNSNWEPHECLFIDKPKWISKTVPTNDGAFWAPEFIDKNRILYSVASNFDDGGPSCTALAVAKKVEEEIIWEDSGAPLTCTTGTPAKTEGGEIEVEAIDPAYIFSPDGKAYLITGGGLIHGTEVNPQTFQPLSGNWFSLDDPSWKTLARGPKARNDEEGIGDGYEWVEAPYVYYNNNYYYLFVNWGACCRGVDSDYNIRVGRSKKPLGPFYDKEGINMADGGGSLVLESEGAKRGPGHAGIWTNKKGRDILGLHYYDARRDGISLHDERKIVWKNNWPTIKK
jgi:arabinan endo-1,5-alpha-L-arabinosidase